MGECSEEHSLFMKTNCNISYPAYVTQLDSKDI